MSETSAAVGRTPWHLWAVGALSFLWNAMGAATIVMAQLGKLPNIDADEAAYYAAQPLWLVIATDIALFAAVFAAIALLLRSKLAVPLFALSVIAIFVTNIYDLASAKSRMLADQGALIMTIVIAVLAILQLYYAFAMKRRSVLK